MQKKEDLLIFFVQIQMDYALKVQLKLNKTKWIWIYDREKRRYKSNKILRYKTINGYIIWRHLRWKRPYKAMQGHIKPNMAIQYHNVLCNMSIFVPLHIFCSKKIDMIKIGRFYCRRTMAKNSMTEKKANLLATWNLHQFFVDIIQFWKIWLFNSLIWDPIPVPFS